MEMDGDVAERYRDFAAYAEGDSDTFVEWALGVAEDPEVHAWLSDLPRGKQQPNLVFAAARWHGAAAPGTTPGCGRCCSSESTRSRRPSASGPPRQRGGSAGDARARALPGRGPLSLIEVGASAGLCLYPDRYDYDWAPLGGLTGSGGPTLAASPSGELPVPTRHPEVAGVEGSTSTLWTCRTPMPWRGSPPWCGPSRTRVASACVLPCRWHCRSPPRSSRGTCSTRCPACSTKPRSTGHRSCSTAR
ncbi:DUF2332 family protein [Nocardioides seonyuensis]|uniref:DUF2332 family protein n=1 Tax=Nocardioides seonyuensis TaxID=2518371 RepID=A0A4P7IEC2_9ACTN|nr:DUF2332 family protein [Nocardioides seonyuensis]